MPISSFIDPPDQQWLSTMHTGTLLKNYSSFFSSVSRATVYSRILQTPVCGPDLAPCLSPPCGNGAYCSMGSFYKAPLCALLLYHIQPPPASNTLAGFSPSFWAEVSGCGKDSGWTEALSRGCQQNRKLGKPVLGKLRHSGLHFGDHWSIVTNCYYCPTEEEGQTITTDSCPRKRPVESGRTSQKWQQNHI